MSARLSQDLKTVLEAEVLRWEMKSQLRRCFK